MLNLPDEIVDEVLRRIWPPSAAAAEEEGPLDFLRYGVCTALMHPDFDPELAERAVAALHGIAEDYRAQGDSDGAETIAAALEALADAHRAHAGAEANGAKWAPAAAIGAA
jgi:hypothetical protein